MGVHKYVDKIKKVPLFIIIRRSLWLSCGMHIPKLTNTTTLLIWKKIKQSFWIHFHSGIVVVHLSWIAHSIKYTTYISFYSCGMHILLIFPFIFPILSIYQVVLISHSSFVIFYFSSYKKKLNRHKNDNSQLLF